MSTRPIGSIAAFLCIVMAAPSLAQEQNGAIEIGRLQALLVAINSELKSDLDQILVLQEAIRGNSRTSLAAQGRSPDIVTVEDGVAAERRAIERENSINARLEAILARGAMLDAQKQPLLNRIRELGAVPVAADARLAATMK